MLRPCKGTKIKVLNVWNLIEGVNGVINRLATNGKNITDYRQNAKKITDYRQGNYEPITDMDSHYLYFFQKEEYIVFFFYLSRK